MNIEEVLRRHKGVAFMHLQDDFMIRVIETTLRECHNDFNLSAETLGISRITIESWCKKLGIEINKRQYLDDEKLRDREILIRRSLLKYGTINAAADSLGVNRITLMRQMKKLGIDCNNPRSKK